MIRRIHALEMACTKAQSDCTEMAERRAQALQEAVAQADENQRLIEMVGTLEVLVLLCCHQYIRVLSTFCSFAWHTKLSEVLGSAAAADEEEDSTEKQVRADLHSMILKQNILMKSTQEK